MKRMITYFVALLIIVAALATMSCSRVTETGNPVQPAVEDPAADGQTYENDTFGVEIAYPSGWIASQPVSTPEEEDATGDRVCFQESPSSTYVCVYMSLVVPEPSSLLSYLQQTYPSRTFNSYSTGRLSGYWYDDPAVGSDGGDMREYYFMSGTVLVRVRAEVFPAGETELRSLLNGISFQ